MRCSLRSDSIGGARLLKRAKALALSIQLSVGVRREILDGYIVEGRRVGENRKATVIDPVGRLFVFGPNAVAGDRGAQEFYGYEGAFFGYQSKPQAGDPRHGLQGVFVAVARDRLHWASAGAPPLESEALELRALRRAKIGNVALSSVGYGAYQYDDHGMTMHSALAVFGRTGYRPTFTNQNTSNLYPFTTEDVDKVAVYTFDVCDLQYAQTLNEVDVEALPNVAAHTAGRPGLEFDSEWLQGRLPSGLRIASVIDRSDPAYDGISFFTMPGDTVGQGIAAPWTEGDVVSAVDGLTWNICFWATTPPSTPFDVGGARSLCVMRMRSFVDAEGNDVAEVLGAPRIYDPRNSSDPLRRPFYLDGTDVIIRWQPNGFNRPCKSFGGVMTVPHAVLDDQEWHFGTLLVTRAGEIVELPLGHDAGRSVCWFVGGDEIDGVVYMVNPFLAGNRLALVSETGEVSVVARPAWRLPIEKTVSDLDQSTDLEQQPFAEPILRGLAAHIGAGWIGFPVAPSLAERHAGQFAAVNIHTGACELRGRMWSRPTNPLRDTVMWSRICVIQRDDDGKAVLIGGYNEGTRSGRPGKGKLVISFDSGWTWETLHESVGPGRGCAYAGNGLHVLKEGQLWRS